MSTIAGRIPSLRLVPTRVTILSAAVSVAGALVSGLAGWPVWATVSLVAGPWVPPLWLATAKAYAGDGWLAAFFLLVVVQTGHVFEHVAQIVQIHALHKVGPQARGVFGNLDIEWVHFAWNLLVLAALVALVVRYAENPWLWAAVVFGAWHMAEHGYIMAKFLQTHLPGNPGLLASGGVISGGLPIKRPDLHFFYNVIETLPIIVALAWQIRREDTAGR